MEEGGGSEPGIANGAAALKRAPWFKGFNPCFEIALGDKSFCNLVEVDLSKFNGRWDRLLEVMRLIARANYRQTCVNLDDGILQRTWHELNEFLRLMGVGLTGIVCWEHLHRADKFRDLKKAAGRGMISMADELKLPYSKLITTIKPSGTLSKIMDTTEGVHKPLGKYIFNNVKFSVHDPLVPLCKDAGYRWFEDPNDETAVIITFPASYESVRFSKALMNGEEVELNLESAVDQLERYKMLMEYYVEHNCSITVSYSPEEVPSIIGWLLENWDSYVAVSFLYRNDPSKTAKDLGYSYLPQEVVTKARYDEYVGELRPLKVVGSTEELMDEQCSTGACPIR